jgi:hypothetical protein
VFLIFNELVNFFKKECDEACNSFRNRGSLAPMSLEINKDSSNIFRTFSNSFAGILAVAASIEP